MRFGALSAVALLSLSVACGGGDDKKNDDKLCEAGKSLDCGAVPAADVGGATFVAGLANATCSADGTAWNTSACTPLEVGEVGFFCNPTGSSCREGLECITTFSGQDGEFSACWETCTDSTSCPSGEICFPLYPTQDTVCSVPNSARNEACGYGNACAGTANTCVISVNIAQECKQLCPTAAVGTQSTCSAGQTCLAANHLLVQTGTDGNAVECGTDAQCDTASEFECLGGLCLRLAAACGIASPIMTDLSEANLQTAVNGTTVCNRPGRDQYCGALTNGGTAEVDCVSSGYFFSEIDENDNDVTCETDADCSFNFGFACIQTTSGGVCGYQANICIAFCENTDGVETGTCGSGLACQVPDDYFDFIAQRNGTAEVTCTTDAQCDTENQFACTQFADGKFCTRSRKVCVDAP